MCLARISAGMRLTCNLSSPLFYVLMYGVLPGLLLTTRLLEAHTCPVAMSIVVDLFNDTHGFDGQGAFRANVTSVVLVLIANAQWA